MLEVNDLKHMRRLAAAWMATVCLLIPMQGSAFAESATAPVDNSGAFAPEQTAETGSHGEVDQSAALGQSAADAQGGVDINEIIAEGDMQVDPSDEPAEDGVSFDTSDEYVSGEIAGTIESSPTEEPVVTTPPNAADPNQVAGNNTARRVDVSSVQFSALTDASLGFTFNYPSNWVNIPGIRTVCFHEPVEEGEFPARITISVKTMSHTVENDVLVTQLTKFMRTISKQYASKTFQAGKVNKKDKFFKRNAYSNTYMAYYGDTEVKGFIIGCGIGKAVVVGHFCASYEDYAPMRSLMRYMLNSAQLLKEPAATKKAK